MQNNFALASRFFVHFFAVPAQLRREMTKFKFIWERERQGDKFYHPCLNYVGRGPFSAAPTQIPLFK